MQVCRLCGGSWSGAAAWWLLLAVALSAPYICVGARSAISVDDDEILEQPLQLHRRPWLALPDAQETEPDDPYVSQMISRLRALRDADQLGLAQKRALDFGMGRGFSGSRAAKHLMGLAAAAYPAGPGRRRR